MPGRTASGRAEAWARVRAAGATPSIEPPHALNQLPFLDARHQHLIEALARASRQPISEDRPDEALDAKPGVLPHATRIKTHAYAVNVTRRIRLPQIRHSPLGRAAPVPPCLVVRRVTPLRFGLAVELPIRRVIDAALPGVGREVALDRRVGGAGPRVLGWHAGALLAFWLRPLSGV